MHKMNDNRNIDRMQFMQFFRDDEKLNELTPDDRNEIFRTILLGNSDVTKKLLEEILIDYCVDDLKVINSKDCED